jgi:BirA family biotin operon repressor/biotin-[acetyl-CoA-carboxylase] ligase
MTPMEYHVLELLVDGRFHSGDELGAVLGVTRGSIWKALKRLQTLGIDMQAVRGRGYRLAQPLELLNKEIILSTITLETRGLLSGLELYPTIDSTSRDLLKKASLGASSGSVCMAEHQSGGRGRHGRRWVSPFGGNLYLSLLWRFQFGPARTTGLSLVIGVVVARTLHQIGIDSIGLKWPNDIVWQGRKLAGILVDIAGESSGPCYGVIGIGVNVRMPRSAAEQIDQPWVDLKTVTYRPISRNRLAGNLLEHLLSAMRQFEESGLDGFLDEWRKLDVVAGQEVELSSSTGSVRGIARGIDASGGLILEQNGVQRTYYSGELSLRFA